MREALASEMFLFVTDATALALLAMTIVPDRVRQIFSRQALWLAIKRRLSKR
jgi:hypothetical protein